MKKIYILTAVFALLTLSLNAQDGNLKEASALKLKTQKTVSAKDSPAPSLNEMLRDIKGMSSILEAAQGPNCSSNSGANRAPLRLNADEELVGPFTTYDTSISGYTGYGFPSAYGTNGQQIYIFSDLNRSDFVDYDGNEIVGFRFALAGNTSQTAVLYDFMAWPYSSNGYFENANRHTWSLPTVAGADPIVGDITIEANSGYVAFKSITVYNGNSVITQWVGTSNETNLPYGWSFDGGSRFASNGDGSYYMTYGQSGGGVIVIPSYLFTGYSNVRLVINAAVDAGESGNNHQITVNNSTQPVTNEVSTFADFQWTFTADSMPIYVQLQAGQWHEYYLDEPIPFSVADSIAGMYLGYRYYQYPSTETSELLYPIAVNPNSTNCGNVAYLTYANGTTYVYDDITISFGNNYSYAQIESITVTSGNTTITSYSYANNGTTLPAGWDYDGTLGFSSYNNTQWLTSSDGTGKLIIGGDLLQGYSSVTVTVRARTSSSRRSVTINIGSNAKTTSSTSGANLTQDFNGTQTTAYTTGWASQNFNGDLAVQLIFKSNMPKTDTPTITVGDPTATSVTVTATATDPTAEVTLTIGDRTETGIGSVSITIDRGTADQNLTATATAQEDGKRVSDEATAPVYVPALPITATPVITYEVVGNNMVITATGNGTVTLEADGQSASGDGSAQIIIPLGNDERTVTATATAIEPNHQRSATATETINIPEFGRSPMPNITMTNNGDGTYTITVTGTGDLAVYIDDAEHGGTAGDPIATGNGSVSFTVEEHSREMTITVQATNQEGDLAVSHTAEETYTIPAMSINGFTQLNPQPANASSPIDLSKLMFVDRFSVDIPDNNSHPFMYEYTLEETQVRQRSSNSVEVYVEHTGSKGQGFYTLKQIDDDKDAKLTMDVENAAMDFNLSELSAPFFYTVEREEEADGESYWGWNAILQRTSVGNYKQTLKYDTKGNLVYNYNDTILPGPHVQLDLDTITGDYNDYKAYVPVVWTMGFDRVNYDENNPTHNSYGASVWTTGVADVAMASSEAPKAERQTNSWNSVNWTAEGGPASLYILDNVVATATMPTVNTLEYEPYMFRIFVKSDNNKLRPYTVVPAGDGPYDGEHLDAGEGTTKGPICVWSGYINDPKNNQPKKLTTENGEIDNPDYNGVEITEGTGDGGAVTYTFKKVKVDRPAGYDENHNPLGPWDQDDVNAMFGALDELANMTTISLADLEVFVRFYYIVKGTGEGHTPWIPTRANAEGDPAGYGTQSPGKAPDPATSVIEIANHGEIVETMYYNMQGMTSNKPFDGINIVVNRYSDGAISVTKVITK